MKKRTTIIPLLLCLLFSTVAFAQQASFTSTQLDLLQKAQQEGEILIIIDFNMSFTPTSRGQLSLLEQQRAQIAAIGESIIDRNRDYNFQNIQTYQNLPHMALKTDYEGLRALYADPDVRSISLNELNEPHMNVSNEIVGSPIVWDLGFTGEGTVVAVLDSGVETSHPHFNNRIVAEACFSTEFQEHHTSLCPGGEFVEIGPGTGDDCPVSIGGCGHGTHVAGSISGSSTNAGRDVKGVAKDADIIAMQVFTRFDHQHESSPCGADADRDCILSWNSDIIAALDWLITQSDNFNLVAANMSLGGGRHEQVCDGNIPSMKSAMDQLKALNVASIVSSGNNGFKDAMGSPACISTAISVGSTQTEKYFGQDCCTEDAISGFSNSTDFLDILAPGQFIESAYPGSNYRPFSGTSMAAPHIAGAWALYRQAFPDASVDEVLSQLQSHGVPLTDVNDITVPRLQIDESILNGVTATALAGTNEGWRQLGSPARQTTYSDMFDSIWTQGFPGSNFNAGTPNILFYDEATRSFIAPENAQHIVGTTSTDGESTGKGVLVYVYEDDNRDGTPNPWPKPLNVTGAPNAGDQLVTLSRTELGDGGEGWHMVSNPFPFPIMWSEILNDATGMHNVAYVWDANRTGGADYIHTGADWDGIIEPFQAFWVQASENDATITFKAEHRSDNNGNLFFIPNEEPELMLELHSENRSTFTRLLFDDEKALHPEKNNTVRLSSLSASYLHLFSSAQNSGLAFQSQYLPSGELHSIDIPLYVNTSEKGSLTLETGNLQHADHLQITLIDHYTGEKMIVDESFSYNFAINSDEKGVSEVAEELSDLDLVAMSGVSAGLSKGFSDNRFTINITLSPTSTVPETDLPTAVSLDQNYPNPFNPITQITYALPEATEVQLEVYNLMGQRVAILVNESQSAGHHTVQFDGQSLASGVYLYRLQAGNTVISRKMTLLK
ncbi:MAG: S8 family peptidase [Balneolales bacterium]|nr:S8 family peptidase [Balneolales bacterium]